LHCVVPTWQNVVKQGQKKVTYELEICEAIFGHMPHENYHYDHVRTVMTKKKHDNNYQIR
jgi:hypothetical protein